MTAVCVYEVLTARMRRGADAAPVLTSRVFSAHRPPGASPPCSPSCPRRLCTTGPDVLIPLPCAWAPLPASPFLLGTPPGCSIIPASCSWVRSQLRGCLLPGASRLSPGCHNGARRLCGFTGKCVVSHSPRGWKLGSGVSARCVPSEAGRRPVSQLLVSLARGCITRTNTSSSGGLLPAVCQRPSFSFFQGHWSRWARDSSSPMTLVPNQVASCGPGDWGFSGRLLRGQGSTHNRTSLTRAAFPSCSLG